MSLAYQLLAQQMAKQMVKQARARQANVDIIAEMPNQAKTPGQRALRRKHGTPRTYARACVNAIGEITCLEARAAIRKYLREWNAA